MCSVFEGFQEKNTWNQTMHDWNFRLHLKNLIQTARATKYVQQPSNCLNFIQYDLGTATPMERCAEQIAEIMPVI